MFKLSSAFKPRFQNISSLVLKVTYRCHLDCDYCYENIDKQGEDMSLDTFKKLTDLVMKYSQKERIVFLFHGGEPTLLPNKWYDEAIAYAREQAEIQKKQVDFSLQTNLLGITSSKIDLFLRHNIRIGTSLDGPASLRNSMRGSEDKAFRNFKRMREAGIKASVLMTINETNYRHFGQICSWLRDEVGILNFKANVFSPVGRAYNMTPLSRKQTFEAHLAILDFMIESHASLIEDNLALEIWRLFADKETLARMPRILCRVKRCGAGEEMLGITPHNNILPCGSFQWDDKRYFLGNLNDPENLVSRWRFYRNVNNFHASAPQSWQDCDTCMAQKICGFGCLAFILRSKSHVNLDCQPTRMRYAYYQEHRECFRSLFAQLVRQELRCKELDIKIRIKELDGSYNIQKISL